MTQVQERESVGAFPVGPFDVIVVDPPWAYGSASSAGKPGSAEGQYETMGNAGREVNRNTGAGIEAIIESVPIGSVAATDSALFLWTTNPKLPFAFEVMRAWGFTYKTTLTWVKTPATSNEVLRGGMGWFFRGATEHVLFGTRGRFAIPAPVRVPNVVEADDEGYGFGAARGRHSEKPANFYSMVEAIAPDARRLDVFARRTRDGWSTWGNEV